MQDLVRWAEPSRRCGDEQRSGFRGASAGLAVKRDREPRATVRPRPLDALIVVGLLLLADVATTLVWQEPVTAAIGLLKRADTDTRFLSYRTMPLTAGQRAGLERLSDVEARVAYLARQEQRNAPNGAAIGRLVIGKLGVVYDVVQGTQTGDLERGPGHYASTALPGEGRTIAIAGHRTTYLAPFRNLNELHHGDRIVLQMPYGRFTYVVQGSADRHSERLVDHPQRRI